jgi:hypothetical protein
MPKTIDMISQRYGNWEVLSQGGKDKRGAIMYLCRCDCGTQREIVGYSLRRGDSTNCGCKINKIGKEGKDLSGQNFTNWTVLRRNGKDIHGALLYECHCECGTVRDIAGYSLRNGDSKSCGCLQASKTSVRADGKTTHWSPTKTHGMKGTPEYTAWAAMKGRCSNPNYENYPNYGGRGITVCKEWDDSFEAFYADVGPRPEGHSLDRIDVNGNYEKNNVKWSCSEEQCNNRTNARYLTHDGRTQTIAQWSKETGVTYQTIHNRLERGWSAANALSTKNYKCAQHADRSI